MPLQMNYDEESPIGTEGGFADNGFHDVLTKNNVSQEIPFGRGLFNVADDDDGVKLPDVNDANRFEGVALRDGAIEGNAYPEKSPVGCIKRGRVWVFAEEALNADDPVFLRIAGKQQVQTITFSEDFVPDNKINLKINGEPIAEVLWAGNQETTMKLLVAAIEPMEGVASLEAMGTGVTVTSKQDMSLQITDILVTEGNSQATAQIEEIVPGIASTARGQFRKSDDGGTAILLSSEKVKWSQGVAAPGIAVLDINIP